MRFRGEHYEAEVNKGSLSTTAFTRQLNHRWKTGWRLANVFEQDKNTVLVWERREVEPEDQGADVAAGAAPPAQLPPPPPSLPPPPQTF